MTIERFIKRHRREIDATIHQMVPGAKLNNDEREMWITNDEGLYDWALREGVEEI